MDLELFRKYRECTDPKKKRHLAGVLTANAMPLVRKLVMKLRRQSSQYEDPDDLIQAGMIGVMVALDGYDPDKGAFSTYAAFWIRHEVQQCLAKSATVYRPRDSGIPYEMSRRIANFEATHGRRPTAGEMGVSEEKWEAWREWPAFTSLDGKDSAKGAFRANRKAHGTPERSPEDGYLDAMTSTKTHEEALGAQTEDPEALVASAEGTQQLALAIEALEPDERRAIEAYYIEGVTFRGLADREKLGILRARERVDSGIARLKLLMKP